MNVSELVECVHAIVSKANDLRVKHAPEFAARVSYCAIFCQSESEYSAIISVLDNMGKVAAETATGPVYIVPEMQTVAGKLRVVKARKPDLTRPELGDADFALDNYNLFKVKNLNRDGFKLIVREKFEMIELMEPGLDVRAYFSNPPVEEHDGIRESLA